MTMTRPVDPAVLRLLIALLAVLPAPGAVQAREAGIEGVVAAARVALPGVTVEARSVLGPGDVLALERGVPKTRWNVAVNQGIGRIDLLGRLHYFGSWVDHLDARSVRRADAPVLGGRIHRRWGR